jgi:cell wall-associated protease
LVVTSANQTISGTATDSGKGGSGITIVRVNGQAATGGAASGNNTANWSRTITLTSGSNTVTVEAVDGAGNIQMQQITLQLTSSGTSSTSGSVTTTSGPLALVSLASSRTSPQPVGTSISFTATATGGRSPYQYKWWLFNGTTWTVVRDWSSSATWAWTPTKPGSSYQVGVWVRDSTMTSDIATYYKIMPFAISGTSTTTSGPLRIIAVTSNLQSPQLAGTRVTFTASAAGGVAPYQYKWWVFDGTAWKIAREWGTSNTYTWTALPRGDSYFVGVWLRDSTTNADVGNIYSMVPFVTR